MTMEKTISHAIFTYDAEGLKLDSLSVDMGKTGSLMLVRNVLRLALVRK